MNSMPWIKTITCPLCQNEYMEDGDPHRCYRYEPEGWGKPHNGRLLVMACSDTKSDDPGTCPAFERYDGPLWQTYRTVDPRGELVRVGFVSAAYGFGEGSKQIPKYNSRLNPEMAERMIACDLWDPWPGTLGTRTKLPQGDVAGRAIRSLVQVKVDGQCEERPFLDIALVGGELYLRVMRSYLERFRDEGAIAPGARITEINGPIGCMRRDLRTWILTP